MVDIFSLAKYKRLDWATLSSFLVACHNDQSMSANALRIGCSKSTLHERLKKFEEITKVNLFNPAQNQFNVNIQGLYLAKYILQLLILENFAHNFNSDQKPEFDWIALNIPLRYYGGPICKSMEYSIQACQQKFSHVLIWPNFTKEDENEIAWRPAHEPIATINADWQPTQQEHTWCLISHKSTQLKNINLNELHHLKLTVPIMPWELLRCVTNFAQEYNLNIENINLDYHRLLNNQKAPKHIFINSALISHDLPADYKIVRIHGLPNYALTIQTSSYNQSNPEPSNLAQFFIDSFEQSFQRQSDPTPLWNTNTKLINWYYYQKIIQHNSISDAAKSLFISQSALSMQLKKLEQNLNRVLIKRHHGIRQLNNTLEGKIFNSLNLGFSQVLRQFFAYSEEQNLHQNQTISFGILPNINNQSTLLKLITNEIMNKWWSQNKQVRFSVVEERNNFLILGLHRRELNLAIIESYSPWTTQIPIGTPEVIGLVIKAQNIDPNIQEISWHEAKKFKLVLHRKVNGIRMIIDRHCLNHGIVLQPELESDSLNLNQHLVTHADYATILPLSAISQIVDQTNVRFIPLTPVLHRVLRLVYLSNRILSPIEVNLVEFIKSINHIPSGE